MKKNKVQDFELDHFGLPNQTAGGGGGGGKVNTEELELVIAAALNESREDIAAKLSQKYYTKAEVVDILKNYEMKVLSHKFVTDSIAEAVSGINATIEEKELVVASAITDLNTRLSTLEN